MRFSIIMPAYNAERFIRLGIQSIIKQSFRDWELIVINDGSCDNTKAIVSEMALEDSRIRLYSQPNTGVSGARNYGLELTKGEYILFADADDEMAENALEIVDRAIVKYSCDVVVFNALRSDVHSNVTGVVTEPFKNDAFLIADPQDKVRYIFDRMTSDKTFGMMGIYAVRKETIRSLRFRADMIVCEDFFFDFEMYQNANTIACLPDYLYFYRDNPSGCVRTFNYKKIDDVIATYKLKLSIIRTHDLQHNYPILLKWLCKVITNNCLDLLQNKKAYEEYVSFVKQHIFLLDVFAQAESAGCLPKKAAVKMIFGSRIERAFLRAKILLRKRAKKFLKKQP